MNKLKTMGLMPKNGQTFAALKNQVEWLTNLEITLKEILEVGGQSLDMDRQAFNPETVKDVKKMLPFYLQRDLDNLGASDGKDAIRKIIDYIIDLRKERQGMMKDADVVVGFRNTGGGSSSAAGQDGVGAGGGRGSTWGGVPSSQQNIGGNVA